MTSGVLDVVRRSVARRVPIDGREVRARHRMLVSLDRLPRPFDTAADTTHVTGSGLVVRPGEILLHRHKRLGLWLQPGGHLDPGESPWAAARRESEEETGVRLAPWPDPVPQLAHLDVHAGGRGHVHLDLRYVLTPSGDPTPRPPDGESQDVRWFSLGEALAVADPGLAGYVRWLARHPGGRSAP